MELDKLLREIVEKSSFTYEIHRSADPRYQARVGERMLRVYEESRRKAGLGLEDGAKIADAHCDCDKGSGRSGGSEIYPHHRTGPPYCNPLVGSFSDNEYIRKNGSACAGVIEARRQIEEFNEAWLGRLILSGVE